MENNKLKIIAVIGARSGSKGVPNKNIREFAGKPLMGWIIEVAKKSHYINRIVVSTDSQEYADIANSFGAETPFLRPQKISGDMATDYEYIKYTLEELKNIEGYVADIVVRIFPTTPLQLSEDIDLCIEQLLKDDSADSSVVIAEAHQHPVKALKIIEDHKNDSVLVSYLDGTSRGAESTARQGYAKAYFRANVIVSRVDTVFKKKCLVGDRIKYHIIPQERAIDIDSEIDFFIAEQLIKKNELSK